MHWYNFIRYTLSLSIIMCSKQTSSDDFNVYHQYDLLEPYLYHHGPTHHHRVVRECQPQTFGNDTYEEVPAHHQSSLTPYSSMVECREFVTKITYNYWEEAYVSGHHILISDPDKTVSILEPLRAGGCEDQLVATVAETAKQKNCILAINAGFYNTTSHTCYGNVVSDGRLAHDSGGVQNVHFGIETDGSLFFGYLPPDVMIEASFRQLVGGVIWLVRDGINYVDVSKTAECSDTEENGNLQAFIDIKSARVAVGNDKQGKLIIVVVDGESWKSGMNLYQFADLLIELGVINAVNLDGGGSATVIINGTLVNYPGDRCNISDFMYSCEREVSTILCVHDIPCVPNDCNNHGDCKHGLCQCHDFWSGPVCDVLSCGKTNCSGHGECTENGCVCSAGYQGEDCSSQCPLGYYGDQCRFMCNCSHGELCEPITGRCLCDAGYMGFQCETVCPYGYYGNDCKGVCDCDDGCGCHPVTGYCHLPPALPTVWQVGHCVADKVIVSRDKIVVDPDQYYLFLSFLIAVVIIAIGSIILNVVLLTYKLSKSEDGIVQKSKSTPVQCLKSSSLFDSSSHDTSSDLSHLDADIDSASDAQSRSLLSRIGLRRKKSKNHQKLWQTWNKVSHRHVNPGSLTSDGNTEDWTKVPNNTTKFVEQPLGPVTSDNKDSAEAGNVPSITNKQRIVSEHTDELLEEISLELSAPEHRLTNKRISDGSAPRRPSVHLDNVFQEESML